MCAKRKLCIVSGSRAEFGQLKGLARNIGNHESFELILLITGSHLSKKHGFTFKEIEDDGFLISRKIDIGIVDDTAHDVAKSTALALVGFSEAYADFQPDLVILLGDRYELLGAAVAAMYHKVPIAHIHGGELTLGAMDEGIRHSLTKLSHLHFVANETYRKRVIQLGENPSNVFDVGGLGVDAITHLKLLTKEQLAEDLGLNFKKRNLLVTFHPVTLERTSSANQMKELIKALSVRNDYQIIFTMPNADPDNSLIADLVCKFASEHSNVSVFTSLGQLRYLSLVSYVDAVIGNSSSGLLEVPSFKKATVNIGDRQGGRLKSSSVIDCEPDFLSINSAIDMVYTDSFKEVVLNTINPYGNGGAVEKIMGVLSKISYQNLLKKSFHDVVFRIEPDLTYQKN
jgi:GDP/UDP-N,N'-diacetylbacillosamine 2-epimerase (hydrolysing)